MTAPTIAAEPLSAARELVNNMEGQLCEARGILAFLVRMLEPAQALAHPLDSEAQGGFLAVVTQALVQVRAADERRAELAEVLRGLP